MIRVLEVLATLKRAGAERVAVLLACGLDRNRFETTVISLYDAFPGGFDSLLGVAGVPVRHLGKRRGFDPRMYHRLYAVFREFRPTIVHTHSYVLRYVFPAAALARRTRIVHTVHNVAAREVEPFGRALHRVAFRRGVVPVAVADEVARSFREEYGFAPAATIPNGIDLPDFPRCEAREGWRSRYGFSPRAVLLVSVARLDPQKNPLLLIEAFAQASRGHADCHLLLAGTGSLAQAAQQAAERLGISGRVHFLGVREDIPALLAASDVFVLASDWEGNPMSVMEAMGAGLPIVATAVGGVPEVVGEGGILTPPGDGQALATAMAELLIHPERRAQLGKVARRLASAFGAESMIAAYARLFTELSGPE
jgi:glycosyltransferase involved in cell wall biosynthesis